MKYLTHLFFLLLIACGSPESTDTTGFANCRYGTPKAIFSKNTPLVSSHTFEAGSHAATETVFFDADIKLELTQSGCEKPKQIFEFTIPGNSKQYTSENWVDMALTQLTFIGNLEESLQPLLFWSAALKKQKETIKLGAPTALEQGFFARIDKVGGERSGILIIELYQN